MASPLVSTQALVLQKESRGNSFSAARILSPTLGCLDALMRKSSKLDRISQVDMFDDGEFILEMKENSHSGFIKEYNLKRRRHDIAKNYNAFMAASKMAKLIVANPTHPENADDVHKLLKRSLDAWERGASPQATLFKCMYLYCKDEGYPIKEEWRMQLPKRLRDIVDYILVTPLDQIKVEESDLEKALQGIRQYMSRSTHLFIAEKH